MTFDNLAMITLQSTGNGGWSYTAYRKPFTLWRSNKGMADVFDCVEDLMKEIALADDLEQAAAIHNILAKSTSLDESIDASGGITGKPAEGRKRRKK